jgi:hypothetical protein
MKEQARNVNVVVKQAHSSISFLLERVIDAIDTLAPKRSGN